MTSLYALLIALTTIYVTPTGEHVLHKRIRDLGGEQHLLRMEANLLAVADSTGVPAYVLAALVAAESGFDARRKSRLGAAGYLQLLPGTPHHAEWRQVCRMAPDDCAYAGLLIGARLLSHHWRVCGAGWDLAIGRFRGLGCRARRQERKVAAVAREWSHKRMLAWKVGVL
jgi:hypothetical protein